MRYLFPLLLLIACKPEDIAKTPKDEPTMGRICVLSGPDFTFATAAQEDSNTLVCRLEVDDEEPITDKGDRSCSLEYNGTTFTVDGDGQGVSINGDYHEWDACEDREI